MRYHVVKEHYGMHNGRFDHLLHRVVFSKHRSLQAAGRMLGSYITGNRRKLLAYPFDTTEPINTRIFCLDTATGEELSRNKCR